MGKRHLKRLAAPRTWQIQRKTSKFVAKQVPGTHNLESSTSLGTLLKETLGYGNTHREIRKILNDNGVKIDGKIRKDSRFPVGIFDTIEFANTSEYFRVVFNKKGKIGLVKIKKEECSVKPCKIAGKTMVNGKLQLNLFDGNNILAGNDSYKVGDTLLLSLPEKKIARHIKLDKKSTILLTGGRHIGDIGNVEDIVENKIIYKNIDGELIETSKKYAFVVGEGEPLITLIER